MKTDDTFWFNNKFYYVDLVGPKTTLLVDSDNNWVFVDTTELEHFLEKKNEPT